MRKQKSERGQMRGGRQQMGVKHTPTKLRVVAGDLRGRKIEYNGDPATRPMKERTRESVFSLLGGHLDGTIALDLFGGTGILAFEAISRGADFAKVLELARPAVGTILKNLEHLQIADLVEVLNVDTLRWMSKASEHLADCSQVPWIVFCCPPYRMWHKDTQRLCEGLESLWNLSPKGSQFVCETDTDFDLTAALPDIEWDVRNYAPALVAIAKR